jgi:lipid II isoglutaminyl synthase (glutamine-hydrolysing)
MRIVTVYPDLLGTYGDAGNGLILERRMSRRGLEVEHVHVDSHEALPRADLYVLGGGEDGPQGLAAERLGNDATFQLAAAEGALVFAVCAGYQILTRSFVVMDGSSRSGLGLIPAETIRSEAARAVGELVVNAEGVTGLEGVVLSGFENHGSRTQLDANVTALGEVMAGVGNGTEGCEGAVYERCIGTYLHGPALARNPELADWLLVQAGAGSLAPLDDSRSLELRRERITWALSGKANGREGSAHSR